MFLTSRHLVAVSIAAALAMATMSGCTKKESSETGAALPTAPLTNSDLKIEDLKVGTGAAAVAGKEVTVNYTGWLTNGKQFDTSIGRGPFPFRLGAHQVIEGWEKGVAGMKVGGKRKLTIPPELAYGSRVFPKDEIPPNSTLIYEVELLGVGG